MRTLGSDLEALRRQLEAGSMQRAYAAILAYMSRLRTDFIAASDGSAVSGLYQGTFDMTYFALLPPALKARDLKFAIVFDYSSFRFQVWLAARNRSVQRRYWEVLSRHDWEQYPLVEPGAGVDAITVFDVGDALELQDPGRLTSRIESAVSAFAGDLERFLAEYDPLAV